MYVYIYIKYTYTYTYIYIRVYGCIYIYMYIHRWDSLFLLRVTISPIRHGCALPMGSPGRRRVPLRERRLRPGEFLISFSLCDMPALFGFCPGTVWAHAWGRGMKNWEGGLCGFRGAWQEDLALLFLLQLYWLEPCIELVNFAELYGLDYAPLARRMHEGRGYVFFGRYSLSAKSSTWPLEGSQPRPRLFFSPRGASARARATSFFFQDQVVPLAPPPAPSGRWADDPDMVEESACHVPPSFLFPFHCWLRMPGHWVRPGKMWKLGHPLVNYMTVCYWSHGHWVRWFSHSKLWFSNPLS